MAISKFEQSILEALSRVPDGYSQRLDGLKCERGVIENNYSFITLRLFVMQRKGLIGKKNIHHSIFPSVNVLPFLFITDAGRAALERSEG